MHFSQKLYWKIPSEYSLLDYSKHGWTRFCLARLLIYRRISSLHSADLYSLSSFSDTLLFATLFCTLFFSFYFTLVSIIFVSFYISCHVNLQVNGNPKKVISLSISPKFSTCAKETKKKKRKSFSCLSHRFIFGYKTILFTCFKLCILLL